MEKRVCLYKPDETTVSSCFKGPDGNAVVEADSDAATTVVSSSEVESTSSFTVSFCSDGLVFCFSVTSSASPTVPLFKQASSGGIWKPVEHYDYESHRFKHDQFILTPA